MTDNVNNTNIMNNTHYSHCQNSYQTEKVTVHIKKGYTIVTIGMQLSSNTYPTNWECGCSVVTGLVK